jgi:hypothetical protein
MEHINWEVEKYLRMFSNYQQDDWVDWLLLAEFTYNNVVHETTGYLPFYLNRGQHLRTLPKDCLSSPEMPAEKFLKYIKEATKKAEESL